MKVPEAGKAELVFTNEAGEETRELIHNFKGAGVLQGMHNLNDSIESFARSCFNFALETKQDLWFATKDKSLRSMTILSRIFSRRYLMQSIRLSLKKQV